MNKTNQAVNTFCPATDIQETIKGVTLYVDLPGINKEAVNIDVDQQVLTIKAALQVNTIDGQQANHTDVPFAGFERRFTLGDELDVDQIDAQLKQGELTLFIPRAEQYKPRKVEVKVV